MTVSPATTTPPGPGPLRRLRNVAPPAAKRAARPVKQAFWTSTSPWRLLPSFLIIGAQKAGTSSLYEYLTELPSIPRAVDKEVHYFDVAYDRGDAWYRSHFVSRPNAAVRRRSGVDLVPCEASPYYLFHPAVPERVRRLLPDVQLVVLLRDPVERALSHYHHEVAHGREDLPLEEALEREEERLAGEAERLLADPTHVSFAHRHHSYVSRGRYAEQLERWFAVFDRERFLFLDSARFFADPQATVRVVCDVVGVPDPPGTSTEAWGKRQYAGPGTALEQRLRAHFAPHNARLWDLIGHDFGWDHARD